MDIEEIEESSQIINENMVEVVPFKEPLSKLILEERSVNHQRMAIMMSSFYCKIHLTLDKIYYADPYYKEISQKEQVELQMNMNKLIPIINKIIKGTMSLICKYSTKTSTEISEYQRLIISTS